MIRYSYHFKNFPQFVLIHTVKSFGINNEEEIDSPLPTPRLWRSLVTLITSHMLDI